MTGGSDFTEFLTDRDRILMAAWTLPEEGPLTDTQRKQAMANFHQYVVLHQIKLSDVARQVGRPAQTTIGELIKGTFRDGSDAHVRRLNMWIEQHARQRNAPLTKTLVQTGVARDIQSVARMVRENQTMGLVVGPTGIGKTRCAQALHDTTVGSIFITVREGLYHPTGLTRHLADKLGVRTVRDSRKDLQRMTQLERVIACLEHSSRLLIIDEAHKLRDGAIELLREIHDATEVPILFLATIDLQHRIERSADPDHGQVYSRFDIVYPLTEKNNVSAGGKPLYTSEDIKQLFQHPPIRLSRDAGHYLQDVANDLGRGSLRRCITLLRNAVRRARKRQGTDDSAPVTVTADDLAYTDRRLKRSAADKATAVERLQRVVRAANA